MAEKKTRRVLRIAARAEKGFWRCGVKHPNTAVDHPLDRFTKKEIETLKGEPMLHVQEVDVPAADEEVPKE